MFGQSAGGTDNRAPWALLAILVLLVITAGLAHFFVNILPGDGASEEEIADTGPAAEPPPPDKPATPVDGTSLLYGAPLDEGGEDATIAEERADVDAAGRLSGGDAPAMVTRPSRPDLSANDRIANMPPPAMVAPGSREAGVSGAYRGMPQAGAQNRAMPSIASPAMPMPQPLPGSVDRENYEEFQDNPVKLVSEHPVSTFSIDVDTASYARMRRHITEGRLPPSDSVRVEELVNYFDYDYALPESREQPFAPNIAVYPSPWRDGAQILHIGIKGYDIERAQRPPANLVFLVDVSGSMSSPDKLPLVQRSLRMLVEELDKRDSIALVTYAGRAGVVLQPTPGSEKARIHAAIDGLSSGGSTAGSEGIRTAYALAERARRDDAVNRIILATDGDFNVGINDPAQLEDFVAGKRDSGVALTVLGFGAGNYNDALMQRLSQAGNGVAGYVDTLSEARRLLVENMEGTLFTIANDVKIQVEFNPARIAEYRLIGYETRALNREDFANDAVDAGDIGAGHAVTALYEIVPVGSAARQIEPGRYQQNGPERADPLNDELAHLRIRYKLPSEDESRLITRPVTDADVSDSIEAETADIRFAAAIAGFGQILRRNPNIGKGWGIDQAVALAQGARGDDPYGHRSEAVQLMRQAATLSGLTPLPQPDPGRPY